MTYDITINDVAKAAGVDKSTVSRVLNGKAEKGRIAPATQSRIIAAARQLGYKLNPKALFTEIQHQAIPAMQPTEPGLPSRQIGLILSPESPTSTLAQITTLEPILAAADYQLVVMTLPTDVTAAQARLTKLQKGCAGILCCPTVYSSVLASIAGACPVIVIWQGAGVAMIKSLSSPPLTPSPSSTPATAVRPTPSPPPKPAPTVTPVIPTPQVITPTPPPIAPPRVVITPVTTTTPPPTPEPEPLASTPPSVTLSAFEEPTPATPIIETEPPPPASTLPPVVDKPQQVSNQENFAGPTTTPETHTENSEAPPLGPDNQEPITEIRLEEAIPPAIEPPPIVVTPETPVTPPPTPEPEPTSTPSSVAPPAFEDPTSATPIMESESPPPTSTLPPVIDTPPQVSNQLVSEPPPIEVTPVTPSPTPEPEPPAPTPPSVVPPAFEEPTPVTPIMETESPPPASPLPPVIDTPTPALLKPEPETTPIPPPTLPSVIDTPPQVSNQGNVAGPATTPETHTENSEAPPSGPDHQEPITENSLEEAVPSLDPATTTEPIK